MDFLYEEELKSLKAIISKTIFKTNLQPAKNDDLNYLKNTNYPQEIINFYEFAEPTDYIDHKGITLRTILELKEENELAVPSCVIFPFGFRCIASTMYGDVYCVDVNKGSGHEYGSIYMVSHDEIDEDIDEEDIEFGMIRVAGGFKEFLNLYLVGKLARSFYDLKNH